MEGSVISFATQRTSPLNHVPAYFCNGGLTPDATCNFEQFGVFGGKPCFRRWDGAWYLWYELGTWSITPNLGGIPLAPHWTRASPSVVGAYIPNLGATGTAVVAAGTH